ncbi:ATP-binding protein [Actinocorallia longicatena]|uniref:ATP-binding protein n=1 Tax=Actinocorallia longicatena TaxID=111803 RepID=A0ABP6QBZ4_9ACTN
MAEDLAAVIDEARRRAFVGRAEELAVFADVLETGTPRRVLLLHGPGGIGKTTLLGQFRMRAQAAGRHVVSVEGCAVDCSPEAFRKAVSDGDGRTDQVLLLDGYEYLATLDGWMREEFLPSVPAETVVVLAGRDPPNPQWRADPGWRALTVCRELAALSRTESLELLSRAGMSASLSERLAALGCGHPLVLALLADAAADGPPPDELSEAPDLVAALVTRIVGVVPDEEHAIGLAVCAYAWLTTEDLLRRAVGERAPQVWAWLESRPYISRSSDGLHAHDLVRDLLTADLRRRSPDSHRRVHRIVYSHALAGLRRIGARERWIAAHQKVFLLRGSPLAGHVWTLPEHRTVAVTPGSHEDHPAVLALIERFEGTESAELAALWLAEQPENLVVVRSLDGLAACAFECVWPAAPALLDADPVLRTALETADAVCPPRPGEQISIARYVIGVNGHERDPHAKLAGSVMSTVGWATRPLAWSFTATTDPDYWGPIFHYLAFSRLATVASAAGPTRTLYGVDWRRLPVERWSDLVAERKFTGATGPPPPELLRPAPLDRARFDGAVRQALADLNRPERLANSPLLGTALVAEPTPADLRATLLAAVGHLGDDPRALQLSRVLDRTYLHPAPTQEAAAEALHLSFSTYRRHLAKATARLTDLLWAQEITGTPLDL